MDTPSSPPSNQTFPTTDQSNGYLPGLTAQQETTKLLIYEPKTASGHSDEKSIRHTHHSHSPSPSTACSSIHPRKHSTCAMCSRHRSTLLAPIYQMPLSTPLSLILKQGLSAQPWLAQNSVYRPGWPQLRSAHLCLLSAGIKGVHNFFK